MSCTAPVLAIIAITANGTARQRRITRSSRMSPSGTAHVAIQPPPA